MLQICYLKPEQLDLICVVVAAAVVDVVVVVVAAAAADVLLTVSVCWQTPLILLPAHTLHAERGALRHLQLPEDSTQYKA